MSASATTASQAGEQAGRPLPSGWFPDPTALPGRALRFWDGEAWTAKVDSEGGDRETAPQRWKRHPFAFLEHRWFHVLIVGAAVGVAGAVAYAHVKNFVLLSVVAFVFVTAVVTAFGMFVGGRLRLGQAVGWGEIVAVGVVGGVVGSVFAIGIETLAHAAWLHKGKEVTFITGPVEETGKLLVPLALFAMGRYRNPRAGLAIVLASAAGFGIVEATTHPIFAHFGWLSVNVGLSAGKTAYAYAVLQPLIEVVHMVFAGMIGAVAWRIWHLRGGFRITWGIAGAVLGAMALHSSMDTVGAMLPSALRQLGLLMAVVGYFAFKWTARELTPPDAIAHVPPGWRPRWLASVETESAAVEREQPAAREAAATATSESPS